MRTATDTLLRLPGFAAAILAIAAGLARAQCATQWSSGGASAGVSGGLAASILWDPDGSGPAAALLAVGGTFQAAGGNPAANVAVHDFATGTWSPLGTGVGDTVRALAVLPTGELVAAGRFATAGGAAASRIASWNGSTWSPLGAGLNGDVDALAVLPNGRLVAGGSFLGSGAAAIPYVAQWDGTSWSALGAGPTMGSSAGVLSLLALPNGDLIVGTRGSTGAAVLQWNGAAWASLGLVSPPSPFQEAQVGALTRLPTGELVAGGSFFMSLSGGTAAHLARWNGSTWSAFTGGGAPLTTVFALATLTNGTLMVAGFPAGGSNTAPVVSWNGAAFAPAGPGLGGLAVALVPMPNGDLIAGGSLTLGGPTSHVRLAGANWSSLSPINALDAQVRALAALPNGDLVAGGLFGLAGGGVANRIARRSGTTWSPLGAGLGTGPGDAVLAVAVLPNGELIAGGMFPSVAGLGGEAIARWNGAAWTPVGAGLGTNNAAIYALAVLPNGDLIAGGVLLSAGGVGANSVARWNGTSWSALGSGIVGAFGFAPFPRVNALAVLPNGHLVAAGAFTVAGGASANCIARWDGSVWLPLGSGIGGTVLALAVLRDGTLVAAGEFASAGGASASNIARWNGSSWSPLGAGLSGLSASVRSLLVLPNGDLLVAGSFLGAGGVTAANVARWNGSAWSGLGPGLGGASAFPTGDALASLADGEVVVGGLFHSAGGYESQFIASLRSTCPAQALASGSGCTGSAGPNLLAAQGLPWTGSTFGTTATGLPANAVAVVVTGLQPAAIALAALLPEGGPGCSLLASPDVVLFAVPVAGSLHTQLVVPNQPAFANLVLYQQVLAAEPGAGGAILAVTSTNALQLTVGTF